MKRVLTGALALSISSALMAATPAFDAARINADVKELASDAFEGRSPATEGERKTVAYLSAALEQAGVQPGGDLVDGKRLWTQAVPLVMSDIVGNPVLSIGKPGAHQSLSQREQITVRPAQDGSSQVTLVDAPLVFVGYGVHAPERNWDDFKGVDLAGKIMVVLVNDPDFESGEGDFDGKGMTYYGRWTYKYEEAARQGAAGVLIVHETAPASYGWATVAGSNANTMFDVVRTDPKSAHTAVEGWIQRDLAVQLFADAGLDFEKLKAAAQTREFQPVALGGQTFSASYAVKSEQIVSHNVVGRIEGSTHPDETIIYSAHWDHIGVGEPDARGDRIFNGATDNASGTAAILEMARGFMAGPQPQRSLVFLAVTAEEKGLLGSEYYANNPLYPLEKTVAVLNVDGAATMGPSRDFGIYGTADVQLLDQLIEVAGRWDVRYTPDSKPEAGLFFRSDHFPFAKRGVPAVSYGAGQDLVDGGIEAGRAAAAEYNVNRYHQQADEWQPEWTFAGAVRDLEILHALGSELANSRQWPAWGASSQFGELRRASDDQRK
ncbi:peptidase M20 [Stenotrophomonas ginsengisoli]|uniref:Peptidase M20 n=1 Tax=Stenotrophomonas ginsengisoli TaxID=336566 RepID=A0A0R0D111_9GAMM|nr:M28 family metallopeptidase [Stenotrophomonas ginsengisoli]KRG75083.1 peptidase M20 [Stenotrophomonas ginsengisoli]